MHEQMSSSAAAVVVVPFSDAVASYYDNLYPNFESPSVISFLRSMGHVDGRLLELGIGVGRLGIPLAEHGYHVHGLEASPGMLEVLRAKPGAERMIISETDFTIMDLGDKFHIVLAPFNVPCCPISQQDRLSSLTAIVRYLDPEGIAVVETFDPARYHNLVHTVTNSHPMGDGDVLLENIRVLPETQLMIVVKQPLSEYSGPTGQHPGDALPLAQRAGWDGVGRAVRRSGPPPLHQQRSPTDVSVGIPAEPMSGTRDNPARTLTARPRTVVWSGAQRTLLAVSLATLCGHRADQEDGHSRAYLYEHLVVRHRFGSQSSDLFGWATATDGIAVPPAADPRAEAHPLGAAR
ncbi:class I SAM-dependent methyltransferase [Salinispora arenicola]|uniref:class I SAM-dependent methyltransferase n=1 Tax=Salinispora arenicola TaxID=168697 RepID=UPI0003A9B786|nr:class I SAM-dependent methyltransferase [Salinispora arenicola]